MMIVLYWLAAGRDLQSRPMIFNTLHLLPDYKSGRAGAVCHFLQIFWFSEAVCGVVMYHPGTRLPGRCGILTWQVALHLPGRKKIYF